MFVLITVHISSIIITWLTAFELVIFFFLPSLFPQIEEKMETMDRLIADHRRAEKERTGKKEGIEALYKRIIARAGRR